MKKLFYFGTALLAAVSIALPLWTSRAYAVNCDIQQASQGGTNQSTDVPYTQHTDDCAIHGTDCPDPAHCTLITNYIQPAVDFLAAFVGVAIVIAIIYGGIEYASSGGDPQKAAVGKKRIRNAIVALVVYLFFYGLLKFALLPGALA